MTVRSFYAYVFAVLNAILSMINLIVIKNVTLLEIWSIAKTWILSVIYCYPYINYMPNCSPIWFLFCLVWANIWIWIIYRYINKKLFRNIAAIFYAVISIVLSRVIVWQLPFAIAPAFLGAFYMYIGVIANEKNIIPMLAARKSTLFLGMLVGTTCSILNNELCFMANNYYGNPILFLVSSIFISMSFIGLCYWIEKNSKYNYKILNLLGRSSIIIVGFNYMLRDVATEIYYLLPIIRNYRINWVWNFFLTFILTIFICKVYPNIENKIRGKFVCMTI